jgi:dihydrofolate synthase/folylpolyglutamate synthase
VGTYTSPHLLRYNERVRIDGTQATDEALIGAFERVEAARAGTSLTYFEFGTLAAALLLQEARLDVAVLEVGLGGRLDAVNVFDADCAVITSIGLDHTEYLGDTRERIGREKAGIFRPDTPAVIAEPDPPSTLVDYAREIGAHAYLVDRDYGLVARPEHWSYWSWLTRRNSLPWPSLRGEYQLGNAAAAMAALDALRDRLPVELGAIRRGLVEVELPGRFQVIPGRPQLILDVAHNPHAALRLRDTLARMPRSPTHAVFSMLRDKDIAGVARVLQGQMDRWFVAPLPGPRGSSAAELQAALAAAGVDAPIEPAADVAGALARAREQAGADDKILVMGSFLTVGAALQALRAGHHR